MNAVAAARGTYYTMNLGLFAQVPVEHLDLPGIGAIGGNLDFLVSNVAVDEDIREHGDIAIPETPYFVVVQAESQLLSETILLLLSCLLNYLHSTISMGNPHSFGSC